MSLKKREITVNMLQANLQSLPIIFLILIIMVGSYLLIWGKTHFLEGFKNFRSWSDFIILFAGLFLHEVFHLAGYHFIGKVPFKSLKIGIQARYVTPYAHCIEPLTLSAYRISALLPGIVLGLIPTLVSIIFGYSFVFIFAVIFTIAAGGDFLLIWLLRKVSSTSLVQDHPDKAGCIILDN
jgi:putative zincin peptidase